MDEKYMDEDLNFIESVSLQWSLDWWREEEIQVQWLHI